MLSNNIRRHKQKYCQTLGNKGDVSEKGSQTTTETETRPKKYKAEEGKDIPTTSFQEKVRFSNIKTLPNETLLRMLNITYKNQARILHLQQRFHNNRYNMYKQKIDVNHLVAGSGIFLD